MGEHEILTTESGAPVADNQNSQTAGPGEPKLLQDHHLIEKFARFERERIPECVVHAKGSGAYGYFEVKNDVTRWTRARFPSAVGKRTERSRVSRPWLARRAPPTRCGTGAGSP
jgi:catalase